MCFSIVQHGVIEVEAANRDDAADRVYGATTQYLLNHAESITSREIIHDSVEVQPVRILHIITHDEHTDTTRCEACGMTRSEFLDRGECFTNDEDLFLNVRPSGFTPCETSK